MYALCLLTSLTADCSLCTMCAAQAFLHSLLCFGTAVHEPCVSGVNVVILGIESTTVSLVSVPTAHRRVQEFSADMNSRPVKRIEDVCHLRAAQFSEDSGEGRGAALHPGLSAHVFVHAPLLMSTRALAAKHALHEQLLGAYSDTVLLRQA